MALCQKLQKKELVLAATMGHLPAIIEMRHILEGEKPSKKWYVSFGQLTLATVKMTT